MAVSLARVMAQFRALAESGVLFSALAQTLALALGIAGLVQAGRNKLYAVLGTVFAATGLGGTGLVLLLGAFMKG